MKYSKFWVSKAEKITGHQMPAGEALDQPDSYRRNQHGGQHLDHQIGNAVGLAEEVEARRLSFCEYLHISHFFLVVCKRCVQGGDVTTKLF